MVYIVDPKPVKGVCIIFGICKSVAVPLYGVPKCAEYTI